MARLYGEEMGREALRARIGHESQIGGVTRLTLDDGTAKGTEVLQFVTGSGLMFQVLPTRGMDIGLAQFRGKAIGWRTQAGEVEPGYVWDDSRRAFFGGLLFTCGYSQVGSPCVDQGVIYGQHGRAQITPARNVSADAEWDGDEYRLSCRGKVIETSTFGEYFENTRTIGATLGGNSICIRDSLVNRAFTPQPHMILYHMNFGWPLLSGHSKLYAPSLSRRHRDKDGIDFDWTRFPGEPKAQPEDVLHHEMRADADGMVRLALIDETPGRERWGVAIAYASATLPRFVQWFQCSPGCYVMGLEPSNCWTDGRAAHRQRGDLVIMEPGERREYLIDITVLPGEREVEAAVKGIACG